MSWIAISDNLRHSRLLAELPFDVLLRIFSECDVADVLNLSATCKRVNEASWEHQTWLNQVRRLQIPVPAGAVPPAAELKEWAISWLRSDERWVGPRTPDNNDDVDDDDRLLNLHRFDVRHAGTPSVMANLAPGGNFVVVLYTDGQIDLKEIKIRSEDEWDLQDVAQYKQDDPEETYIMFWSQLLTETNLGHLVAYVDRDQENLVVFLVDHVAGIIRQKQVVKLDEIYFYEIYDIHAKGNTILCFYEHGHGWGITVSELGPDPVLKHFTLSANHRPEPWGTRFFMVSENTVVVCDVEGIHLYRIPELSSAESFSTLSPTWEWLAKSKWFCGSACMTFSRLPVLYLQGGSGTHTIIFRTDPSGRNPVVTEHHISEELPAYLSSIGDDNLFMVKGRKGLRYEVGGGDPCLFDTCLLGTEGLAGRFSAEIEGPVDDGFEEHKIRFVDFDEMTGRVLIATHGGVWGESGATRISLADLPL